MNPQFKPLVQKSLAYLAIRSRSELEIKQYLAKKTTDVDLIQEVIQYLQHHQLINDLNFGTLWAESRVRRLKGDIQIIQELKFKGLSTDLRHQIIENIDQALWLESMATILAKKHHKFEHLTGYPQKAKIYQILQAAGYSSKLIDAFLRGRVE